MLIGLTRDGQRLPQPVAGSGAEFQPEALLAAAGRLAGKSAVASHTLLTDYDSDYYARHSQGAVERSLPVLRVELADAGATHLYLDPQDGRVLLRQDAVTATPARLATE